MDSPTDSQDNTLTILIVEDDEAIADLLRMVIADTPGWAASVTRDAAAAREAFRQVRIDVLVVDVNLPGISGLELLAMLREDPAWQDQPVVLISAVHDQPEIRKATAGRDSVRFLAKPFDVDTLVAVIGELVG